MNDSCDECIHAKLIDTATECYMVCTNKNYNISFPDYIGKCKYQEKENETNEKK